MKSFVGKYCHALPPFLFLFFIFFHANATTAFSKEEKRREEKNAKAAESAEVTLTDHFAAFDGNRIFCYLANNGDLVTDNVGRSAGFFWPSILRTSRSQKEADLIAKTSADFSSGLWVAGIVNGQIRAALSNIKANIKERESNNESFILSFALSRCQLVNSLFELLLIQRQRLIIKAATWKRQCLANRLCGIFLSQLHNDLPLPLRGDGKMFEAFLKFRLPRFFVRAPA
ncbi:MAG: hypothetical protein ONB45_02175 [candidate division KSB1 bacterium]|nr:hypothetical protein [candidate division KSB1 bacterium]